MKLEPTAVEEWAKEFERCKKRQLSNEEVSMVISASLNEEQINKDKEVLDLLEGKPQPSIATVLYKRINTLGSYKITPTVALLSEIVVKNFGDSTMLCAYMQYKAYQLGVKIINVEIFCRDIIPFGIPTNEEFQRLWDLQKLDPELLKQRKTMWEPDNGLDYKVTYESIMNIGDEKNT